MSNIVEANTYKESTEKQVVLAETEELKPSKPEFDPLAAASQIFESYFPIYCKYLDELSTKQIRRISKAAMGLPLEDKFKPNLKDAEEVQAYYVFERLLQAKMIIMHSVLTTQQKEFEAKKALENKEGEKV